MSKVRVIIDTDPGIDDAMAIVLALGAKNIIVEGLTIVHGNSTDVEKLGRNACTILEQAGRPDIPVHIGAYAPLIREDNTGAEFVHGNNCLGDIEFPHPKITPHPHHSGVQFIISKVVENPGEIVIIALGPLTNIALAMKLYPKITTLVKDVVIMGGAVFVPGNSSPVAEANIMSDPEAARLVLNAKWPQPITMIALGIPKKSLSTFENPPSFYLSNRDITEKIRMTQQHFEVLKNLNKTGAFIYEIVKFCQKFYKDTVKTDDFPVHDATAVMAVVDPDLFTESKLIYVDVETKGEITRGMTVPILDTQKEPNVKLITDGHIEKIIQVYAEIISVLP